MAEIPFVPIAASGGKVYLASITKPGGVSQSDFTPPVPVKWLYITAWAQTMLVTPGEYASWENGSVQISVSADGKTVSLKTWNNYVDSVEIFRFIYGT